MVNGNNGWRKYRLFAEAFLSTPGKSALICYAFNDKFATEYHNSGLFSEAQQNATAAQQQVENTGDKRRFANVLKNEDIRRVEAKIGALEQLTSAEFKVIVCAHAWFGLKRKARKLFTKHQLDKTQERNGVLILLVEKDRELLVYGDEGIHAKVGQNFWQDTSTVMMAYFKRGDYAQGLIAGLHQLADVLTIHFPARENQANELSNEILFEK